MGGIVHKTPTPQSASSILNTYAKMIPKILGATAGQIPETAQQQLTAAQQTQPGFNQLNAQQLGSFAPTLAGIGQGIINSNALSGAQTNVNQLEGPGGAAANAANRVAQGVLPTIGATNTGATNLLGAINLNGLSPGEFNATERANNQTQSATGNLGLVNPTNVLNNALNFGGAFNQKLGLMGNALGAANTTTGTNAAVTNPVGVALGQPNPSTQSNFGLGTFSPTTPNTPSLASNNTFGFGSNTLGSATSANNAAIGANASNFGSIMGAASSLLGGTGGGASGLAGLACCFIFLESYNGALPSYVRELRDHYYKQEPKIASGYKKMAKWLVPLMRQYKIVRHLVNKLMVTPLSRYGAWLSGLTTDGRQYKKYKRFWFSVWKFIG